MGIILGIKVYKKEGEIVFEFYYNNNIYKAKNWVEVDPNNFLIMAEDHLDRIRFIYSRNINNLPVNLIYLRNTAISLSRNELYNIRKVEKENMDLIDFKNVNLEKLDFASLLFLYRRLNFVDTSEVSSFKKEIYISMKKSLYEYEEKGRVDFQDGIIDLINLSLSIHPYLSDSEEIRKLIEEFALFIKIKTYSKMNISDLLDEKKKFEQVLKGKKSFDELGYPDISYFTLKNRIKPAVEVLLKLKEDLILTEIFNITRHALLINPFKVNLEELENVIEGKFQFVEDARFDYNYAYYEDLGIETDIVEDEIRSINKWQYEKVSEHLFLLAKDALKDVSLNDKKFIDSYKYSLSIYKEIDYVIYLIRYVLKTMDID